MDYREQDGQTYLNNDPNEAYEEFLSVCFSSPKKRQVMGRCTTGINPAVAIVETGTECEDPITAACTFNFLLILFFKFSVFLIYLPSSTVAAIKIN